MQKVALPALLIMAVLQAPTLSERSNPNLGAGLAQESVLLQKQTQELGLEPLHSGHQLSHLPLRFSDRGRDLSQDQWD